eukprot:896874-Prorocentrum_minimum.AAC.2
MAEAHLAERARHHAGLAERPGPYHRAARRGEAHGLARHLARQGGGQGYGAAARVQALLHVVGVLQQVRPPPLRVGVP